MDSREEINPESPDLPRVEVDTNWNYYGPHRPSIDPRVVTDLGLVAGQRIVAFMPPDEEDAWEARVVFEAELPFGHRYFAELD